MPEKKLPKRLLHPVYKTAFHVTEELYESPTAKEPLLSRSYSGRFRNDLLRTLCLGTVLLSAVALASLLAGERK